MRRYTGGSLTRVPAAARRPPMCGISTAERPGQRRDRLHDRRRQAVDAVGSVGRVPSVGHAGRQPVGLARARVFLFALTIERGVLPLSSRAPLMIGFLGAYTTFSTLTLESWRHRGRRGRPRVRECRRVMQTGARRHLHRLGDRLRADLSATGRRYRCAMSRASSVALGLALWSGLTGCAEAESVFSSPTDARSP